MNRPEAITDQQLRDAGYTENARQYPLDDFALECLAAWVGVAPEKAPPAWWYAPNDASRKAWGRVAALLERKIFEKLSNLTVLPESVIDAAMIAAQDHPPFHLGSTGMRAAIRAAIEALGVRIIMHGYIKLPESRDEAEKMILVAESYLKQRYGS